MKLTDREWKEFNFIDIFIIKGGFYNKKPPMEYGGNIPFLGAVDNNNGITEFYTLHNIATNSKVGYGKNEPLSQKIYQGNCICVTNNGSVGYAYYQKHIFTCSHDINPLYLKDVTLTENLAMFLISAIEQQKMCFKYSRKWRPKRMRKSKILLPVNKNNKPDYQFMEDYVKEIMHRKRQEYIDYVQKILAGGGKTKVIQSLMNKKWKAFKISDIFEIFAGKRLENKNQIIGNIPFIGATDSNNGITNFVSNKNTSFDNNVLGINYNGSVCEAFYHPYKCIFSDDVKRLHLKNSRNTENVLLFFSSIIKKQKEKYRYAYKFNTERMKKQYIMLPVDDKGNPDYEYMEYYTQNKMFAKYNDYLQYANNLE